MKRLSSSSSRVTNREVAKGAKCDCKDIATLLIQVSVAFLIKVSNLNKDENITHVFSCLLEIVH